MNVTFNGYLALACNSCNTKRTIESRELKFEQDSSPEAEDDGYIRYLTQIDAHCVLCSAELHVKLDVWEYPEAVANYSYHSEQGVHGIQCEFNIEHYFDDESGQEGVVQTGETQDEETESESNNDDNEDESEANFDEEEDTFIDDSNAEKYVDHYDHDE